MKSVITIKKFMRLFIITLFVFNYLSTTAQIIYTKEQIKNFSKVERESYEERLQSYRDSCKLVVDKRNEEIAEREAATWNAGKGTVYSQSQVDVDVDELRKSPCYGKLGYDPYDNNILEHYEQCEAAYYSNLRTTVIFPICAVLIVGLLLYLGYKKGLFKSIGGNIEQYKEQQQFNQVVAKIETSSVTKDDYAVKTEALKNLLDLKLISQSEFNQRSAVLIMELELAIRDNEESEHKKNVQQKLQEALDAGVISQEEYDMKSINN